MTAVVEQVAIGNFSFPTRVVFGPGRVAETGQVARQLHMQRPLIVTDAGLVKAGLLKPLTDALSAASLPFAVFDGVEPNPTETSVFPGVDMFRAQNCDGIIGLGGGSALDAAKAIRLCTTHARPLAEYDDLIGGDQYIQNDMPPMIAIATTSGTGSEVSRSTVITLKSTGRKTVIFSPYLMPSVAVADPALTSGLPAHLTAWTGCDALTHNVEAWLAKGFHPFCDALALHGTVLILRYLRRAVENGNDIDARSHMMMASMMGAVAFQKGLGATHSLAHPLGSVAHVHHGEANAILLPHVLAFNREVVSDRLVELARFAGLAPTADAAIDAITQLIRDVGVPAHLREAGVKDEHIAEMVPLAVQDGCHALNPRPCTAADFESMYRAAL